MSERISLRWYSAQQAYQSLLELWAWAKPLLMAGHRLVVEIRPDTRSNEQNRLLHSRIRDVSMQLEWAGRRWDATDWKRLLTAAWCRTRNEGEQIVPAIDGQGFDVLYQRTSKLTRGECADLSEFIMAWGTEQSVRWCPASLGDDAFSSDGD